MVVLHLTTTIRNGTNHSWNIFIYSIFVLLHKAGPHNRFYFRIDTWYQHIYRFLEYNSLNATSPKNDKCTSYDNCTICMTTHINSNILLGSFFFFFIIRKLNMCRWVLNPQPHPSLILMGEESAIWARAYWLDILPIRMKRVIPRRDWDSDGIYLQG